MLTEEEGLVLCQVTGAARSKLEEEKLSFAPESIKGSPHALVYFLSKPKCGSV